MFRSRSRSRDAARRKDRTDLRRPERPLHRRANSSTRRPEPHFAARPNSDGLYVHHSLKSQTSLLALRSLAPATFEPLPQRYYYIGIDFGTTFSGVAWASSLDQLHPDNIHLIQRWATAKTNLPYMPDNSKVPTSLLYSQSPDTKTKVEWGYEAPDCEDPIKWFKLLLLNEEDIPEDIRASVLLQHARARLAGERKTVIDAIADYLRMLWGHTKTCIEKDRGASRFHGTPFKVVVTVPAIWKPYAHARMKEAIKRSGIMERRLAGPTIVELVAEPEAAALSTLKHLKSDVREGEIYIVCDAGGGTTDVISYRVKQAKPLILTEVVVGKGKLCGAMFVDEKFLNGVKARLGTYWDQMDSDHKARIMNNEWEFGPKRVFDGIGDREWKIHVFDCPPNTPESQMPAGLPGGNIILKTGNLKTIFSKVIYDIIGLVNDQVKSVEQIQPGVRPRGVILVGGFGGSRYLSHRLKLELEDRKIEVMQSTGSAPWTAICTGAVIRAGTNIVHSRKARMSYGTTVDLLWREDLHGIEDRNWDPYYLNWLAPDRMEWYIWKGQDIEAIERTRFRFSLPRPEHCTENKYCMEIFLCEEDPPPSKFTQAVKPLCTIECQLGDYWQRIPARTNAEGTTFKELRIDLEMIREGENIEFVAYFNGQQQSSDVIAVDMDPD